MSELQNPSVFSYEDVEQEDMNSLIDSTISMFDDGDLVTGTVVQIEHDEVLVDIGFKSEGVIPAKELSIRKDANPEEIVSVGETIECLVLQKEDKDGRLILSKKRAEYEHAWKRVEDLFNNGQAVEGEVIEVVKGGLILDIGLRGFLPASLVDLRRVHDLNTFLGTRIEARIIEMDRNRNNVVLSRRAILEDARRAERSEILAKLQTGMRLKGTISSLVDFGAFVDLGGLDGLIHISELSWNHINHPSEVVKVGDEVDVEVLEVDLNRERISLGLKQTQEDPWAALVEKYPVGNIVDGTITKLVPFGAFVDLSEGVEGLVHISEMAPGHIDAPAQVTKVGDAVKVKVMDVDLERRRISLSMKEAAADLGIEIKVEGREDAPAQKSEDGDAAGAAGDASEAAVKSTGGATVVDALDAEVAKKLAESAGLSTDPKGEDAKDEAKEEDAKDEPEAKDEAKAESEPEAKAEPESEAEAEDKADSDPEAKEEAKEDAKADEAKEEEKDSAADAKDAAADEKADGEGESA